MPEPGWGLAGARRAPLQPGWGRPPFLRIWSLVPEMGQSDWLCSFWAESPRGETPPPPPLPTVPAQQAVGPQAGVHGARGTYKLGASPHAGPFPADAAPGPAALQGSCPPASGPARGPPCLPRWGGERWKVTSSAWRGCLRLTGWNRSRDPISRPTSQKEDCDLGPGEQEGPSLPLRFRVDEQMLVSLLEAGWAAVGGMGPQPGRQSGCLNDA